jgi:hypothetical protein
MEYVVAIYKKTDHLERVVKDENSQKQFHICQTVKVMEKNECKTSRSGIASSSSSSCAMVASAPTSSGASF